LHERGGKDAKEEAEHASFYACEESDVNNLHPKGQLPIGGLANKSAFILRCPFRERTWRMKGILTATVVPHAS
jgi:hypothetical protein